MLTINPDPAPAKNESAANSRGFPCPVRIDGAARAATTARSLSEPQPWQSEEGLILLSSAARNTTHGLKRSCNYRPSAVGSAETLFAF
jgi:hypothetical protein